MRAEPAGQAPENARHSRKASAAPRPLRGRPIGNRPKGAIAGAYAKFAKAGTALAIIPIPIGCASTFAQGQRGQHGGARNCASRTSDGLTAKQARLLIEAALTAHAIGRPLNRHIIVHWEGAGVPDARAATATTAFLKYWREWLGGATAYIWTRENGDGKGSHLHILAHLPAARRMTGARSRRWLERITGRAYRAGTIRTKRIGGSRDPDGPVYAVNLQVALAYVLKGADTDTAAALGIAHEPGGCIIGKRCGTSRNIGARARRTA